jgi:hypothetical protein
MVSNENHLKKLRDDHETLSGFMMKQSQRESFKRSFKRSPEKSPIKSPPKSMDLSRSQNNYRSVSNPAVMIKPQYEVTQKTTNKLWKNFESIIKGSMHMGQV